MIISYLHFNSFAIAPTRFTGYTLHFGFGVYPSYFSLEIVSVDGKVLLRTLTLVLFVVVVMIVFLLLDTTIIAIYGATTITVCFISELHSLSL